MKRIYWILTSISLYSLLSCSNGAKDTREYQTVKTDTVVSAGGQTCLQYPGKVKAAQDISLAFRVSGTIQKIYVKDGARVQAGQLLAELDPTDYQVQLDATEAEYKQIKAEAERVIALYKDNGTTPSANDKAVYGLKQITAKYRHHKDQLGYTRLYAPFSGYIQKRLFEAHETVGAGMPVLSMISNSAPEVEINLPAAEYSFVTQVDGRGVYSFCMCPGGFVVPAASGPHQIVVNGMSPSNRGSKWSNSGMVVEIRPEDLQNDELRMKNEELGFADDTDSVLSMMHFQEALEAACWQQGNMRQTAPAQRMVDFTRKKLSYDLPESSYSPGLVSSPLHFWMPPFIANRLSKGFQQFGKTSHGFLTNDAVLIGVETRTSSPVRIVRDNETLQHITVQGLFPCGEGAGYAGGIVSAGIDGERCAEAVAAYFGLSVPQNRF